MVSTFLEGLLLQASLILALGAQNLFIIDISLKENYHYLAAAVCAVCDVILIFIGVLGVSVLIVKSFYFKLIVGVFGVVFLLYYAILKLKQAFSQGEIHKSVQFKRLNKKKTVLTALSFTFLNPHVYIDTFFLVGGSSARYSGQTLKIMFGAGAGTFSVIWFFSLALCSSLLSKTLSNEKNERILSLITGVILGYLALKMGVDVYSEFFT